MLTFDQIKEIRQGHKPSLSLQQAARNVGLDFQQCPNCRGAGYTKAHLLVSPKTIQIMAKELPDAPVPIQYDRCNRCDGAGGWILMS